MLESGCVLIVTTWVEVVLKSTALLMVAFLWAWVLRHRSAAARSGFWHGVMVALIFLPLVGWVWPGVVRVTLPMPASWGAALPWNRWSE